MEPGVVKAGLERADLFGVGEAGGQKGDAGAHLFEVLLFFK